MRDPRLHLQFAKSSGEVLEFDRSAHEAEIDFEERSESACFWVDVRTRTGDLWLTKQTGPIRYRIRACHEEFGGRGAGL